MSQNLSVPPKARCCDYCGATVSADSFRDRLSYSEFHISGLCQGCQDDFFIAEDDLGGPVRYALRRGAVAASVEREGVSEVAVIPFTFTVPRRPVAWEARYVLRMRSVPGPLADPLDELCAMECPLAGHQIRVRSVDSLDHPLPTLWHGRCELAIGLDTSALDRVAVLCPALAGAARASIAVPFQRRYGTPVASLGDVVAKLRLDSPHPAPSALRMCSWIAALLAGPSPSAPPLFPDVLLSRPDVLAQCPPWRMEVGARPEWVSDRPRWRGYVE